MERCTETHLRSDNRVCRCTRPAGHPGACRCPLPLTVWPSERALELARADRETRRALLGLAYIGAVR